MTLTEFVITHDLKLKVEFSNITEKWYVTLDAEVKDNGMLRSPTEHRNTPEDALFDFISRIKGRTLVKNPTHRIHRREMKVPNTISL